MKNVRKDGSIRWGDERAMFPLPYHTPAGSVFRDDAPAGLTIDGTSYWSRSDKEWPCRDDPVATPVLRPDGMTWIEIVKAAVRGVRNEVHP